MLPSLESLGIPNMTFGERIDLMDAIWDTVPLPKSDADFSPELKALLDRRLDAADADPNADVPWEVMREQLGLK